MDRCVFCDIISGKLSGHVIYEDKLIFAIMDIRPLNIGHVLVMPKRHYEKIFDINEKLASELMKVTWKISNGMNKILEPDGINILQNNGRVANQTIPHLHIHVIPRKHNDGLNIGRWSAQSSDPESLSLIAQQLRLVL